MTRGDHKYVIQSMRDLLGVHTQRRRGPADVQEGELPVGVAARVALIWAAGQDRSLLYGGTSRVTAARQEARRELLQEAVRQGPTLDLRAPVALPVRCGKPLHPVRLDPDGTLVAEAHPELDVDAEQVAASLGGELLPCLREMDAAGCTWSPPVADDGPRLVGIEAGELLSFVLGARTWLALGYDLAGCAPALEAGVRHEQVAGHLQLGMAVADAVQWRGVPPAVAVRWDDVGFARADVDLWTGQGRTLEQAEAAAAAAGNGRWLARWARVAGSGQSAQALAEWAAFGVPVGVWGEAASRGVRAPEVPAWLEAGFQPVEVLRYAHLRVPLEEAVCWRDAGFTAYVATGFLGVGMTLPDACALRGLPVTQVQQLWRDCGSVAGVLEAGAS